MTRGIPMQCDEWLAWVQQQPYADMWFVGPHTTAKDVAQWLEESREQNRRGGKGYE